MILRLLRARVKPGEEARLRQYIREEATARAFRLPGLCSFQPALRTTSTGLDLVLVTTWNGFEDLSAAGPDLNAPVSMPGAGPLLIDSRAEHYELALGEARAMPLRTGKLRLTRILIRKGAESSYYEAVRRWSDRLLDDAGMVAFSLGRRVVGQQDEIIAAQVWQDEAALLEAAGDDVGRPMGEAELSPFWAADPVIEHFDAIAATDLHADAPAIMVVDDDRRYVHATPAAEALSGRPLARLLTMRIEDVARAAERDAIADSWKHFVADGSMRGPYVLERPDGSEVPVQFVAKANVPWPGTHVSVLFPAGDDEGDRADLDVDAALVEAGLVAR